MIIVIRVHSALTAIAQNRRLSDLLKRRNPWPNIPTEEILPAVTKRSWRVDHRRLAVVLVLLAFSLAGIVNQSVQAVPPGMSRLDFTLENIQRGFEPAIYTGGIFVSRSRNTIAGGVMGCAAGVGAGIAITGGLSLVTGGLALLSVPVAGVIGCGVGAFGGAALGRPLDDFDSL